MFIKLKWSGTHEKEKKNILEMSILTFYRVKLTEITNVSRPSVYMVRKVTFFFNFIGLVFNAF